MKRRGKYCIGLTTLLLFSAVSSFACPVCNTGAGKQVRALLFDGQFGYNLLVTLLPFPFFLGIAALLYFGPPKRKRPIYRPEHTVVSVQKRLSEGENLHGPRE